MKSYAVIGLGLFGSQLAASLYERGENVLAIDVRPAAVEEIADRVSRAAVADAKKREALLQLGVQKCDCAVVAMTSDLAASVLVTMNLKAMGVPQIICKAQSDTDREIMETLGATSVVIPERMAADKLCNRLVSGNVIEYIELSNDFAIVELRLPRSWHRRTIKEINVRAKYGVNIIAVRRGSEVKVSPDADFAFREEDILVLLGDSRSLSRVQKSL